MSYMSKMTIRKSASCQVYQHHVVSSSSDTSGSSSSWENSDTPLRRFNRLLRTSVARHWAYFRKDNSKLRIRGRSVSDAGLCSIVDNGVYLDPTSSYLDITTAPQRRSLDVYGLRPARLTIPELSISYKHKRVIRRRRLRRNWSAGAGTVAASVEEASDSEPEKPRRGHHLRVPTPALPGQSTGNFATGSAGGGCGAPRSAPSTPLQLDNHPRAKQDKHAVKPLSGSAPSVRLSTTSQAASDSAEGSKQPSKARQKKFQQHFPQVGPEERVLNYYSCALVGDLLLQGHLYITKNYFAFYSNVFGYVTKLLIPITSVLRITKEKVARIIPNAVGVCTRDERHVFGSLLSRDATYKLMTHVWKASRVPELATPKPNQELRASEAELDASEYSPEDDSSSGGGDHHHAPPPVKREVAAEAIIATAAGAAVIQPALLTGGVNAPRRAPADWRALLVLLAALLALSAALLAYRLYTQPTAQEDLLKLSGEELYAELVRWRARLHGRAASELHSFLNTNLLLLTKVRQSLEALSGVILTDIAAAGGAPYNIDVPNDTAFS